jgi:DNA-binding Lrp family transcriptional regulator
MDATDKRILALLHDNARIPFAEVGRTIGLSRTAVQDRVARLEANGTIAGYQTKITNREALPLQAVVTVKITSRPCDPALNWLVSLPEVHQVMSIAGEFDALLLCHVADAGHLSRLNDTIGSNPLIASATSHLVLRQL